MVLVPGEKKTVSQTVVFLPSLNDSKFLKDISLTHSYGICFDVTT